MEDAWLNIQANSPTRSETAAVNESSGKKKKKLNCSAWVVGKVGQAQYISIKQGGRKSRNHGKFASAFNIHAHTQMHTCKLNFPFNPRVADAATLKSL